MGLAVIWLQRPALIQVLRRYFHKISSPSYHPISSLSFPPLWLSARKCTSFPSIFSDLAGALFVYADLHSTNLIIILGMMQVSKKIPFDDPQVLMAVRALYTVSNLIIAGIYFYLQTKINGKKGSFLQPCAIAARSLIDASSRSHYVKICGAPPDGLCGRTQTHYHDRALL